MDFIQVSAESGFNQGNRSVMTKHAGAIIQVPSHILLDMPH